MSRLYILACLLFLFTSLFAHNNEVLQKIESAYQSGQINYDELVLQKFYALFDNSKLKNEFAVTSISPVKCATHLIVEYNQNKDLLSESTKEIIENILSKKINRDDLQSSSTFTSPLGLFEITYSTTGTDKVPSQDSNSNGIPDYVEKVGEYFDYSWTLLVDQMEFLAPALTNGTYPIVIRNLQGYYGATYPTGNGLETEIEIENDFAEDFPPNDDPEGNVLGAAKVTAIHEFKHATQIMYNGWSEPSWFIEADATWSEDIGFDYVNDYYNYLAYSQIRQTGRGLQLGDGYEDNLYFHFFTERYGINTNREIWERRAQFTESVFSSVENMLTNYSAYFDSAFAEYYTWLYNTGDKYDSTLAGFGEAENFPSPTICETITSLPAMDDGCSRNALSGNFLFFESAGQNKYLQISLDTPSGSNIAAIITHYSNGISAVEYYGLNNNTTFELFVQPKLSDIDYMVVIPVVTSISGSEFDYLYTFDEFKTAEFHHTPLIDSETSSDVEFLVALETPQNLAVIDSLKVLYQLNSGGYQSMQMLPTGNTNEYAAQILDPGSDVGVDYYFQIPDLLGDTVYHPEHAPDSVFSFYMGTDMIAPQITHTAIQQETRFGFPLTLFANISDNIALDSTYLEYKINNGEVAKINFTNLSGDFHYSVIDLYENDLTNGDSVFYRIVATDSSVNKNVAALPLDGFYSIGITNGYKFSSEPNGEIIEQIISNQFVLSLEEDVIIDDVNVYVKTDHAKFSELLILLVSPQRKNYTLYDQDWLGTPLENIVNPFFTFDDEAYFDMSNFLFFDSANAQGNIRSAQMKLSELNGTSTLGDWTLVIFDRIINKLKGNLLEWGLIVKGDLSTDVTENNEISPDNFILAQNYPNPFNPSTKIEFSVPLVESTQRTAAVKLIVYDILGRVIKTLVNENLTAGNYDITFDASELSSGIYFYRLSAGSFVQTRKMLLVK